MLQEETSKEWGFLKRLCDEKADVPGEGSCERMSQEGEATGELLKYAQSGVGNSRMKRRLHVWEEEQVPGRGRGRFMIRGCSKRRTWRRLEERG